MRKWFELPFTVLPVILAGVLVVAVGAARSNQAQASRYYPQVPAKITAPEMAVQTYFDALFFASNLTEAETGAAGGTVGDGMAPYPAAYSCWTKGWRDKHSLQEFVDSWKGTANLELLRMVQAGKGKNERRYFVEVKAIEAVRAEARLGIFYYSGFFDVENGPNGWAIAAGNLEPELPGFKIGGHSPWRGDPVMVARQTYAGNIESPVGTPKVSKNANGSVTIRFNKPNTERIRNVVLLQREDGIWEVLEKY